MAKYNSENEIVKKKYYEYLHESKGRAISTVDGARKAILRYEEFDGFCSFKSFDSEKAMLFKKHLLKDKNRNGEQLSLSTVLHTLNPLKDFLLWLSRENGFKRAIQINDIEYLNLTI